MKNISITLLTDIIPYYYHFRRYHLQWRYIRWYMMDRGHKYKNKFTQKREEYRGPSAVTRSLMNGLDELNIIYNYNPTRISEVYRNVIVLSNIGALEQSIILKCKGKIDKLFAGPNLFILPSDYREISTANEIDKCIVPSKWVYNKYAKDMPQLLDKLIIWPAGVDANCWKPDKRAISNKNNVLIYIKNTAETEIKPYMDVIDSLGFNAIKMVYGSYNREQYLKALQQCKAAIFFTKTETQGIALAEAWAVNVPTFVYAVNEWSHIDYPEKTFPASSAPYLSPENGMFFSNEEEFKKQVHDIMMLTKSQFAPRDWILNNMTDKKCAERLLLQIQNYRQ